tara:strand:+ start:2858 stop:3598 length:741 start_codon:yes stop_codon:yes gene_type:complete
MPKRRVEDEANSQWRYASITMTKDFTYFLDRVIDAVGKVPAQGGETFNASMTKVPSRRLVVQDAMEVYLKCCFQELVKDYQGMLRSDEKHEVMDAQIRWETEKIKAESEVRQSKKHLDSLKEEINIFNTSQKKKKQSQFSYDWPSSPKETKNPDAELISSNQQLKLENEKLKEELRNLRSSAIKDEYQKVDPESLAVATGIQSMEAGAREKLMKMIETVSAPMTDSQLKEVAVSTSSKKKNKRKAS